ncbi:GNAT family N-acetyltransferase [Geodermatophilus sp. YIM 151500]|uniref:GNAT family N-acetyltransferase n=1 Tax=Geodermatophilus sp. YIM 151500 TaxID=2984531 RepID=UPI0021E3962A|nr:GNAT family N-acetyltransferase [Geodermatophilus sp. YIM 151500]MCV2489389.1 GNAT family N-acetyltransferase [Geodermatophilus sp. YIM 151500]
MPGPPSAPPAVAALERLAARSWRGLEEEPYGDWLLRAGGGFTGRANSVLAVGDPPEPLPDAVRTVTRWYAARGLRARAQVPLPGAEQADAAFAAAGWTADEDVLVLTAPLADWSAPPVRVDLAAVPDAAWLAGYRYRGTPLPPVAEAVLVNADDPVFAAVRLDPPPAPLAAVARGAVVEDWLVVTAVTVAERHRRRGLATAVMAALAGWARARGARSCVLQTVAANAPATGLYRGLGFSEHHRYHYRLGPPPPPAARAP